MAILKFVGGLIDFYLPFLDLRILAPIHEDIFKGYHFGVVIKNNLLDELAGVLVLVGGILVAFSIEKMEDEFIAHIRLESLVWATYVNYGLLLLAILFVYGGAFLTVMIVNMFTLLIFFIVRFHIALYQANHSYQLHEK